MKTTESSESGAETIVQRHTRHQKMLAEHRQAKRERQERHYANRHAAKPLLTVLK